MIRLRHRNGRRAIAAAVLLAALGVAAPATGQSCWTLAPHAFPQPDAFPLEFHAVVEIPAGGTVKYEIDPATGTPVVDRFIVSPVAYPANYGFVAGTMEGDGDPLDVLVWTREPIAPGAIIRARPVGVLRMTDSGERDTKILAVPAADVDPRYDRMQTLSDLGPWEEERLVGFFSTYKDIPGGQVELAGFGDAAEARAMLEETHAACRRGG